MSAFTDLSKKHGANLQSTTADNGSSALSSLREKHGIQSAYNNTSNTIGTKNTSIDYESLKSNADYGKYSTFNVSDTKWNDKLDDVNLAQKNTGLFGAVNKAAKALAPLAGRNNDGLVKYQYLTDDEVKNYNYLHNSPNYGSGIADEYLKSLDEELNKRMTGEYQQNAEEFANKNALTGTAATIGSTILNTVGGFNALKGDAQQLVQGLVTGENIADANNQGHLLGNISDALTQGVTDQFDSNVGKFLYGTGKSIIDSGAQLLMYGPLSTYTMASNAYTSRMKELQDMGANDTQMIVGALASGAIEALTEKFSVENLLKNKGIDSLKSFFKETVKQMGTEASEEAASEILNALSDKVFDSLGGVSDYRNFVDDYVAQGGSAEDADGAYIWQKVVDTGLSALGGAISGGVMGSVGNTFDWSKNKSIGADIATNQRQEDVKNLAKSQGRDDLVKRLENGNDAALGMAERQIVQDAYEKANKKKATEEDKKNLIGTLINANRFHSVKTGAVDSEGNVIKINDIDFENQIYKTDKGDKKFDEVRVTDSLSNVINLSEELTDNQRAVFLESYKGGNLGDYVNNFELAYSYALKGDEDSIMRLVDNGHLDTEQMLNIWKAGVKDESSKASRVDQQIKAAETRKSIFGDAEADYKVNDSAISYDGSDKTKIDFASLNDNQKANVVLSQAISMGLNNNVTLFSSKTDNSHINGQYDENNNTIYIDVYATNTGTGNKDTTNAMLTTMSHELTHWSKVNSPKLYNELSDIILPVLAREEGLEMGGDFTIDMLVDRFSSQYPGLSSEQIQDELVARACENMLQNSEYVKNMLNNMSESSRNTFIDKVKEFFAKIADAIKNIMGRNDSNSWEYRALARNLSELEEAQKKWDKMIEDASHNTAARDAEIKALSEGQRIEKLEEAGISYDKASGSVYDSWKTEMESDYYTNPKDTAKILAEQLDVPYKKALKYINDMNGIANYIFGNRGRLEYYELSGSAIVPNAEYGGSVDFNTMCTKARLYIGTLQAIKKAYPNSVWTPGMYLQLRRMMLDEGLQSPCGCCYVQGSRAMQDKYMSKFIEQYKDKFPDAKYVPSMYDLTTPEGNESLRINHPEAYTQWSIFMNNGRISEEYKKAFGSQMKPKQYMARRSYKGEILNMFEGKADRVNDKNFFGGFRLQSFSDFEIVHLIDCMQVIMDMSRVGLYGQAYTKVPEFAEALGNTGLKINCSLIAKGVDKNGKLILDDVEGMPAETAFRLRKKYSKNVGTVVVCFTQEQIKAALADNRIDFVLPFHHSQWKKSQFGLDGLRLPEGTKSFQQHQNERYRTERGTLKKTDRNLFPSDYWDYNADGRQNGQNYLDECNKREIVPKFPFLLTPEQNENGKTIYKLPEGAVGDGYFKLLIDFRMYSDDYAKVNAPQAAVVPDFNMTECKRMLEEYTGGHDTFPVATKVKDDFVNEFYKNGVYASRKDSDGNALTEAQQEFFKDSKVRDESGNLIKLYHGTNSEFYTFERTNKKNGRYFGDGFYLTDNEKSAKGFGNRVVKAYANILNPLEIDLGSEQDLNSVREYLKLRKNSKVSYDNVKSYINGMVWNDKYMLRDHSNDKPNYDGVVVKNSWDASGNRFTEYVVFDSNQIKSVDNTNPTLNPDIRYSLKDEAAELTTGDMIEIISQNPELKNKYKALYDAFFKEDSQRLDELERLRKTEGIRDLNMINDTKVEKYAKQILKDMNSNVDVKLFTDRLKRFYLLFGDEDVPIEDIQRMAQAMAKNIINNSLQADVNEETKRQITELRKELQGYNISLSDQQKRELRYTYGSDWMKQFIGKVKIRSTGTPLDNTWGELAGRYPYLFGSDTTESDEGVKLAEVLNGLYDKSAYTDAWNDRQREEYEKLLANELLDGLYTVTNSAAEKYIQKERKLAEQYNRRLVALGLRKGRADHITQEDIFADYAKALRGQYEKYRKEYDELHQKRELKRKIIDKSIKLNERLKKNDKDFHVPDVLKQPLKIVLDALQLQNHPNDEIAYKFSNLRDAFEKIPSQEEALDTLDVYFNTDGYFEEQIGNIIAELNDKMFKLSETLQNNETESFRLEVLSLESLRAVNEVLTAINVASKSYDEALASTNHERISPRGESSMNFLDKLGKKTKQGGYAAEKLKNFLGWANITQIYGFDRFGEGGQQTFKAIMEGQDKLALNTREIINFAQGVFTGDQAQTWNREAHEVTINGETYQISTAQIMSLYCLAKRESAQQHLFKTMTSRGEEITGQGIVINSFKPENGKGTVRTNKILVERGDVERITKLLTEEQVKVADKLQEFMSTTCSDWGNYVTMKRFGIMQFTEDNYFPMAVDSENRPSDAREVPQGASIFKMLNASFTKSLNEKANGALILDSIFDVFNAHANDMAMYNAMGLAVLDTYRWLSYKRTEKEVVGSDGESVAKLNVASLKTKMREVYGADALNWVLTYLEDLNGARAKQTSGEALANKIMSNYKTAAVAANIRVALMQPTAYLKALAVMDNKYLARAFFEMRPSQIKVAKAEMNSKSPIAIWKNELNMYDLNVGRAIEDKVMQTDKVKNVKGAVEKTMEWSMKLAEAADELTWTKLYRACQLEAEDKGIEKGEAFDYAVNERFRELCFRTQVFDSINSRSEMMRRKDMWHKILTSFASEPSLSYSMLSNEVFQYLIEARTDKAQAWANHSKKIARNTIAFLLTEIAVSLVAALPDVMRDDDNEDEFIKKYFKNAFENFGSDMVLLPYLRDIVSIAQGFDPSRPDEEVFSTAVKATRSLVDGKWNYRDIYNVMKLVSQSTGIPFSNLIRDVKSLWNQTVGEVSDMKVE